MFRVEDIGKRLKIFWVTMMKNLQFHRHSFLRPALGKTELVREPLLLRERLRGSELKGVPEEDRTGPPAGQGSWGRKKMT